MPYKIIAHGNAYQVINADTGIVHAKNTTLNKAKAQVRLLLARERPPKHLH